MAGRRRWPASRGRRGCCPGGGLALCCETTDAEAKLGWLDSSPTTAASPASPGQATPGAAVAGQPRSGRLLLSDLGWARPVTDGKLGPAPRRMGDVVKPGDVVMVEPAPPAATEAGRGATPVRGTAPPAARAVADRAVADRMVLRQIPLVQAALVSLDPATGRVLALVGGWNFDASQFNRATQAKRQPGSSFKPFVYLTALEHGVSPSQQFLDAPVVVDQGPVLGRWRPNNFEREFRRPDAAAGGAGAIASTW